MDNKLLLTKCITLLYKESLVRDIPNDSRALVNEALSTIKTREIGLSIGTEKDAVISLKDTIFDILCQSDRENIDRSTLLQRLQLNLGDNDKAYQVIDKALNEDQTEEERAKSIKTLRRSIERHVEEFKITNIISQTYSNWNFNREKIKDTNAFLKNVWVQLEPMASLKVKEDNGVVNELCISNPDKLINVVSDIRVSITDNRIFRTGWQALNRMLQGGIRPGEFWLGAGLQHGYKSGIARTLINQISLYNKPLNNLNYKKSAVVYIGFEDTIEETVKFMYQQLMSSQTGQFADISACTTEEVANYMFTKLSVNGFQIFLYRIDANKWTCDDLFAKVESIENSGFNVEFCSLDYMEKIPTTGCFGNGTIGSELKSMTDKIRTYFNIKGIACYSPHQLSTEAKRLLRGTVTDENFVQTLAGRGYYQGSAGIDQIPDGIIIHHKFVRNGRTFMAFQRDRHRISTIVDEEHKHFYLEFPKKAPIPDDINGEDTSFTKLPVHQGNATSATYSFE